MSIGGRLFGKFRRRCTPRARRIVRGQGGFRECRWEYRTLWASSPWGAAKLKFWEKTGRFWLIFPAVIIRRFLGEPLPRCAAGRVDIPTLSPETTAKRASGTSFLVAIAEVLFGGDCALCMQLYLLDCLHVIPIAKRSQHSVLKVPCRIFVQKRLMSKRWLLVGMVSDNAECLVFWYFVAADDDQRLGTAFHPVDPATGRPSAQRPVWQPGCGGRSRTILWCYCGHRGHGAHRLFLWYLTRVPGGCFDW